MWSPTNIHALRERLGLSEEDFAKLLGVDARTVRRWEAGEVRPTGAAEQVLTGLRESLDRSGDNVGVVVKFIIGAAAVGGLAYLLVKLIDHLTMSPSPPGRRCPSTSR